MLTRDELMAIPLDEPERLFPNDEKIAHAKLADLAHFHPDRGGDDEAQGHVNALYREARIRIKNGTWREPGVVHLLKDGGSGGFKLRPAVRADVEVGKFYGNTGLAAWVFDPAHAHIAERTRSKADLPRNLDPRQRALEDRFLPVCRTGAIKLKDGRRLVTVEVPPNHVRLTDLVRHLGGLEPTHVGWIINRLHDVVGYLRWAGLGHHALVADNVWIEPRNHAAAVLGGWWYARGLDEELKYVPARVLDSVPPRVRAERRGSWRVDLECLRLLARELLPADAPAPLRHWSILPAPAEVKPSFDAWKAALKSAFGPSRYVELRVTAEEVYTGGAR